MALRDLDIRAYMHRVLQEEFKDDVNTIVIDELCLCQGEARIDIAVINGLMHGYEIKSDRDNLQRLSGQIKIYDRVMDTVTIITGERHIKQVLRLVPNRWGVKIAKKNNNNKIVLETVRNAKNNPNIDIYSVVQLLWRDEALKLLIQLGLEKGYISKPRKKIWEKLARSIPSNELRYYVREQLKSRRNWRTD